MKFSGITATMATCLVCGASPGLSAEFDRITSEKQFVELVVGKFFSDDGVRMVVKPDGRISGTTAKGDLVFGRWVWGNGYFCRSVKVGMTDLGNDCQVVKVNGSEVSFTRDQGEGKIVGPYTLE